MEEVAKVYGYLLVHAIHNEDLGGVDLAGLPSACEGCGQDTVGKDPNGVNYIVVTFVTIESTRVIREEVIKFCFGGGLEVVVNFAKPVGKWTATQCNPISSLTSSNESWYSFCISEKVITRLCKS